MATPNEMQIGVMVEFETTLPGHEGETVRGVVRSQPSPHTSNYFEIVTDLGEHGFLEGQLKGVRIVREDSRLPSTFVAVDPKTGSHLRQATDAERAAYLVQPGPGKLGSSRRTAFRKAIRVGDVLIDQHFGPGVWFGGAGF